MIKHSVTFVLVLVVALFLSSDALIWTDKVGALLFLTWGFLCIWENEP